MRDRVVIITGGGTGIGRAAAIQFAHSGAWVLVVGRRIAPLEEAAGLSDRIVPRVADIQHQPDITTIIQTATQRWGRIDVVVNNAGVFAQRSLEEIDPELVTSIFATNILGPTLLTHGPSSLLRWFPDGRLAKPREVLERLNSQFCSEQSDQFFTLFYGVLVLGSLELCYANAGHPGPAIVSEEGAIRTLQNSSFPVGVVDETSYEDEIVQLEPGDRLWLFSDGLIEAMNKEGDQFGKDRLEAELQAANANNVHDGVEHVLHIVEEWAGHDGPQDDISLIALGIAQGEGATTSYNAQGH